MTKNPFGLCDLICQALHDQLCPGTWSVKNEKLRKAAKKFEKSLFLMNPVKNIEGKHLLYQLIKAVHKMYDTTVGLSRQIE